MLTAITREVSRSLGNCELTWLRREPIDIDLAIAQHHNYERCLEDLGARVISLSDEVVLTGTFETVFQPETGAVLVKSIPVSDANNKFGAVASTRSARLYLGADHALYAQVRQSGAGVMLVMPVAGTFSEWARWDVAAP